MNDVLDTNLDLIKKLYKRCSKKYIMTMDEAIELFTKKSECGLNDKEAIYCYGMSKMTVVNENDDSSKYNLL